MPEIKRIFSPETKNELDGTPCATIFVAFPFVTSLEYPEAN